MKSPASWSSPARPQRPVEKQVGPGPVNDSVGGGREGAMLGGPPCAVGLVASMEGLWARHEPTRLLLDNAHDAFVSMDIDGDVTGWNAAAEATFGWTTDEVLGRPLAELIIPPALRDAHRRGLERFAATGEGRVVNHRVELTACHRNGHELAVEITISPMRIWGQLTFNAFLRDISDRKRAEADLRRLADIVEAITELLIVTRDVSARNRAERELREARERFEGAFRNAPIGMALVDLEGRFLSVNEPLCEITGRSEAELLITDFQAITHAADLDSDLDQVRRMLAGEIATFEMEKRYSRPDGGEVWVLLSVSLFRDAAGEPLYFIRQMQNISERKSAEEELRRYAEHLASLALQEPLTGVRNDRGFQVALQEELARARRHGGPFSVVLFDVDHFGELNADRGREAGDRALRAVAAVIQGASRSSDTVARIGGDEFALILPETEGTEARTTAERIQARVAKLEHDVRISLGVAQWPANGDTQELLVLRAEMSLHGAKPARRQRMGAGGPAGERPESNGGPCATPSIDRLLAMVREHLDMDVAYLSEFRGGEQVLRALEGDGSSFGVRAGGALSLEATYCRRVVAGELDNVVADARANPVTRGLEITRAADVGAYVGVPLKLSDGRVYGTLCCASHAARPELGEREVSLMEFLARVMAEQLEDGQLRESDRRAQIEVAGIHALIAALEARDHYTGEHSKTVVKLATAVANGLRMSEARVLEVEQIAILHDIGKLGIPDAILQKRESLTKQEWQLMHQHPAIGGRIVAGSTSLAHLAPAVRAEHERWDGHGYPDGLRGAAIPMASRIAFACDAYDAMTSDRPYRPAMSKNKRTARAQGQRRHPIRSSHRRRPRARHRASPT